MKIIIPFLIYVVGLIIVRYLSFSAGVWVERLRYCRARQKFVENIGEVPTDDWPGALIALDKLAPPVDEPFWSVIKSRHWPDDPKCYRNPLARSDRE